MLKPDSLIKNKRSYSEQKILDKDALFKEKHKEIEKVYYKELWQQIQDKHKSNDTYKIQKMISKQNVQNSINYQKVIDKEIFDKEKEIQKFYKEILINQVLLNLFILRE